MIIVDTSGLLAWFNRSEPAHDRVRRSFEAGEPLVVSPYVIAELDYLVATRMGVDAELTVLQELAGGAYILPDFGEGELQLAAEVVATYRDQTIGLADASLVVLAERFSTRRVLTLDRRHFTVVRPLAGGTFEVLPD